MAKWGRIYAIPRNSTRKLVGPLPLALRELELFRRSDSPALQNRLAASFYPRPPKILPATPSAGWDICPADGERLPKQTLPPFFVRTAGCRGIQGGTPFLCSATKKGQSCRHTERAKLGEAAGEVVENPIPPRYLALKYPISFMLYPQNSPSNTPQKM